jgi:hypothetical protein
MKTLKKILLYISSFFLIGFGFLLTYAVVFEENTYSSNDEILSGIILTSAFSLISLLFFLPGVHLSGFIKNNKFISRLNIFTILSLFHLATLCGFLIKFMKYNYEVDRNLAIYCFIVSLICFYLRKKSKISSKDIASKISSLTDFKYKEFDDNELSKLLGNNTKIISRKNVCFPFNFHIDLESKSDVEAQQMGFDVASWNKIIQRENKKIDENKRLKERYEDLMMQYEQAKQSYNIAKMNRNQMIANARKGNKLLPWIANPLGSPPKAPKKPNYYTIEDPKKEDFYTKDKGTELIKNLELKHNENQNYFNFLDKDSFSKIFDISEWKAVTKIMRDIYTSSETKNLGQINSDFEPQDQDIKIKFNNSFLYSDSFEGKVGNSNDLLKANIIDFENNHKKKKVEKVLNDKDLKLGNFKIKSNKISYNIKDLNYLPFLRLEVEGKNGDKKIEIIDYLSRTVVSLSNK